MFKPFIYSLALKRIPLTLSKETDYIHIITKNSLELAQLFLKNKTISVLGYGSQGRAQSLNLKDQKFKTILGLRKNGKSWNNAVKDGWEPQKDLFTINEATKRGDIISNLLSDFGQIDTWDSINKNLTENKTLYFSHGFGMVYNEKTEITPPTNIDVVMVAPKGSGLTVRNKFLEGSNKINASVAIHQNFSGNAIDTVFAMGIGIGCNNFFKTTFEKEVYSDLTGERSVLMGLIQGAFKAQYDVLRERGHSPIEAWNETIGEALESLYPLVLEKGMDWMYSNCSTTAQRGALDWAPKYYKVIKPLVEQCYDSVKDGTEVDIVIEKNKSDNYQNELSKELEEINNQEMWQIHRQINMDFKTNEDYPLL